MNLHKMLTFLLLFCVPILAATLSKASEQKPSETGALANQDTVSKSLKQVNALADMDSLLVIHFHPEVQCSCCIKVGIYSKEGLERFYAKPYQDSCILFKEYNIDEDTSTAKRYKVFWSALGFEKFSGKKADFKEVESVWEFCEDKDKFLPKFRRELDEFIKEAKKKQVEAKNKRELQKPTPKKPQ